MSASTLLSLRPTRHEDIELLFEIQLDPEARQMAAFTSAASLDRAAYLAKWDRLLQDPTISMCTILEGSRVVGSVSKYVMEGDAEITYWLDRTAWGRGIGTWALREFLTIELTRPIYGRVVHDNLGSQRVLEHCGFVKVGTDRGFAHERQAEVEEYIYRLD